MKAVRNRIVLLLFLFGIVLFPLLTAWSMDWFRPHPAEQRSYTFDLRYRPAPAGNSGAPDQLVGNAPPNMELAVYLNDDLLSVIHSNARGQFAFDMPVLPQRRNQITILPTELDSSTLPLLYDPLGFQALHVLPAKIDVLQTFLTATIRESDGIHLYGVTAPLSEITIAAENCEGGTHQGETKSDDEGSFHAVLPVASGEPLPAQYCVHVQPKTGEEKEFIVSAPAQSPARSGDVWKRNIVLQFSPKDVRLIFSVEMPDDYLVYRNLVAGNISEVQFVEYIFGKITLNAYIDPRLLAWRQEKEINSHRVKILVESQALEFLIPEDTATTLELDTYAISDSIPPYGANDTLTARLNGVRILQSTPPADVSTAEEQAWRGALAPNGTLNLRVSRTGQALRDPIGRAHLLDTLSRIVSGLQIRPPVLLRQTLEGQIISLLPVRVPRAVQAQVYDTYRLVYLKDPFTGQPANKPTFQSFVRDLPSRLPTWLAELFFGALWLIPSALTLWALQSIPLGSSLRAGLGRLAIVTAMLVLLTLNWLPILDRLGGSHAIYVRWLAVGFLLSIFLFLPVPRWTHWMFGRVRALSLFLLISVPLISIGVNVLFETLPDGWVTTLLTAFGLTALATLTWFASQTGHETLRLPSLGIVFAVLLAIAGLSIPIQALPLAAQLKGMVGVLVAGLTMTRPILPLALLLGITMALLRTFDRPLGGPMKRIERDLGRVVLVAFAIGVSPSWGFFPMSIVVGLILFEWLLPPVLLAPSRITAEFVKGHHAEGLRQLLVLNRQTHLWRAVEASAQKSVREGKQTDKDAQALQADYELAVHNLEQPDYLRTAGTEITLRELALNFGAGPRHRDNLRQAVAWGLLLVTPLLLIEGWQLAISTIESALPFPFLSTVIRLVAFIGQYLAMAVFMGYFFPYMRGRNGLEKGAWMAATIVVAFLPYHLFNASTITEWGAVIIWAGSVLAYNLLIGLLAFDVRTLTRFRLGWIRLPELYDFGSLTLYLTGSGAPLITTIVSAIFGKLDELVPALLHVAFPSFSLSGAQFELLQVLLDLANRVASSVLK